VEYVAFLPAVLLFEWILVCVAVIIFSCMESGVFFFSRNYCFFS